MQYVVLGEQDLLCDILQLNNDGLQCNVTMCGDLVSISSIARQMADDHGNVLEVVHGKRDGGEKLRNMFVSFVSDFSSDMLMKALTGKVRQLWLFDAL